FAGTFFWPRSLDHARGRETRRGPACRPPSSSFLVSRKRSVIVVVRSNRGDDAEEQEGRDNQAGVEGAGRAGVDDDRGDVDHGGDIAAGEGGRGREAESRNEGSEFGHDHAP